MLQLDNSGACAEVCRMEGCSLDASFFTFKTKSGFRHGLIWHRVGRLGAPESEALTLARTKVTGMSEAQ